MILITFMLIDFKIIAPGKSVWLLLNDVNKLFFYHMVLLLLLSFEHNLNHKLLNWTARVFFLSPYF